MPSLKKHGKRTREENSDQVLTGQKGREKLKKAKIVTSTQSRSKNEKSSNQTSSSGKKSLDVSRTTFKRSSGVYRPKWLGEPRDPPKHGSKPIPIGKPGCLEGIIFVLTGLNESLTRDETSDLIKKYGGIERSAVSGKTKYLVAGFEMEDGRPISEGSKYKAAISKNIPIINEDELLAMIYNSNPEANEQVKAEQAKAIQARESNKLKDEKELMADCISNESLFTLRYAPKKLSQVIGNQEIIADLKEWLGQWRTSLDARGLLFFFLRCRINKRILKLL